MSQLDLQIQGSSYGDNQKNLRNMVHIQKQVNASGGFKIPQESIDKRSHRNKFTTSQLGQDLPSKNELFQALGVNPATSNDSNSLTTSGHQPSSDNIDKRRDLLKQNRQFIQEKQSQVHQLPPRIPAVDLNQFKNASLRSEIIDSTSSADIEHLIEQHRQSMKPLEDEYFENRLSQQRFNPRRPFQGDLTKIDEDLEHSKLQQSQTDTYFVKQRNQSAKVRVTYHDRSPSPSIKKPSIDKMRRNQRDYSGPHGTFLEKVMPPHKLREVRSQSAFIKEDDFQQRFKQHLRDKKSNSQSKLLDSSLSQKEFDLFQSTSPNRERWNVKHQNKAHFSGRQFGSESPRSGKQVGKKLNSKRSAKDDELFLIRHIFQEMDPKSVGRVDKIETIKYLMQNPQVLEAFDVEPTHLNKLVNAFKTKDQNAFHLTEFATFLQKQKKHNLHHSGHEGFGSVGKVSAVNNHASACLLTKEQIQSLRTVFDQLDRNGDEIVPRIQFIQELRNNISVVRLLHVQACYVASIDKIQTLDRVLSQVEQSYHVDKESMAFISWYQFMEFMNTDGQQTIAKSTIAFAQLQSQAQDNVDDQDNVDAPSKIIEMIRQQFGLLDKHENLYALTSEVADSIRRHPMYSTHRREVCRSKAKKFFLPSESLEEVINRMEVDAAEFMTLQEVMAFFTRRGVPKFQTQNFGDNDNMLESLAKSVNVTDNNFNPSQPLKKSRSKKSVADETHMIDGYDSDPEIHTYQDKLLPRQRFGRQTSAQAHQTFTHRSVQRPELQKTAKSNLSESHNFNYSSKQEFLQSIQPHRKFGSNKPSDYLYTVTRPEPYLFEDKERSQSTRQRKLQQDHDGRVDVENKLINYQFKAKDVPQHVKDNLYEKIQNANDARRVQVKKDSVAITLQNEKPFSFYRRDKVKEDHSTKPKKKKYWERDRFIFKAKEIPWHVHVNLWKQMQEDEENTRKERVAKHAQQLAMESKMPPRMEKHERLKQAQHFEGRDELHNNKFYNHSHRPQSSKKMPDFERLHTNFQDKLERKKQQMRTTETAPFVFSKSHKGTTREYLDNENIMMKMTNMPVAVDRIEEARKTMNKQPKIQPASTKKWIANLEKLKKEREMKREKQDQILKEDQLRLEKAEKFKSRVQQSKAIQDNTKKLKDQGQKRKDEFKQQSKAQQTRFRDWKAARLLNASNQPLLVERPNKRDLQLEKMKALSKFHKILHNNGVVGNKTEFLNEEEKKLFQDMEHLKKNGYADEFDAESADDD